MLNWFCDKERTKNLLINAIQGELEVLLECTYGTANYWIDNTHNAFACIDDNANGDRWIEIHFELYDNEQEEQIVGDLLVVNTEDVSKEELRKAIAIIVDFYYGE